jgi:hypothetical protein
MQLTHSLKARGFNPRGYEVQNRFQSLPSKFNLYRYSGGGGGGGGGDMFGDDDMEDMFEDDDDKKSKESTVANTVANTVAPSAAVDPSLLPDFSSMGIKELKQYITSNGGDTTGVGLCSC